MVRLADRPDMTLDVYRERKTTVQQQQQPCNKPLNVLYLHSNINILGVFTEKPYSKPLECNVFTFQ